jgi:arsenate reductase (thioredoxin)
MAKQRVLFLCTGNSARSQMGEAFLRHYADEQFEVHSAGLDPKGINPYTIRVMDEIGIDIRNQTSDSVRKYMGFMHFNYAITVCSDADKNCPHALWSRAIDGTDEEKLAKFREVRDQIAAKVQNWVAELETV